MTNHIIDNSASSEFGKTILWQYDKAVNLRRTIGFFQGFYEDAVQKFWDSYPHDVMDINTSSSYGLSVWGKFVGFPRPMYLSSETNDATYVSDEMYRRTLKARFMLMKASGSSLDISKYMSVQFPAFGSDTMSSVRLIDEGNMAMRYTANEEIGAVIPRVGMAVDAGAIVAVPSVYKAKSNIQKDEEWDASSDSVQFVMVPNEFSTSVSYAAGSFVMHGGKAYVAIRDTIAGEFIDDFFSELPIVNTSYNRIVYSGQFVLHVEMYIADEDFVWEGHGEEYSFMTRIDILDKIEEGESPINASPWDCATQEEKDILETFLSTDPDVMGDVRYDALREMFPYPAGVKDNTSFDEVVFGFSGQEKLSEWVDPQMLGNVHAKKLEALSKESYFRVLSGSSVPMPASDPEVGSFCEESGEGFWDKTVFISNEKVEKLER